MASSLESMSAQDLGMSARHNAYGLSMRRNQRTLPVNHVNLKRCQVRSECIALPEGDAYHHSLQISSGEICSKQVQYCSASRGPLLTRKLL